MSEEKKKRDEYPGHDWYPGHEWYPGSEWYPGRDWAVGEKTLKTFRTMTIIAIWVFFLSAMASMLVPLIMGLVTGALAGSIDSIDAGKLWFYRHGLSFLIGVAAFFAYFYAVKLLRFLS